MNNKHYDHVHEHLYQNCLGPIIAMLVEKIERQLLPEVAGSEGVYVEYADPPPPRAA